MHPSLVLVMRLKICFISEFQVFNIVLLTIVIMLYIWSSECIHLINASVYVFIHLSPFSSLQALATKILLSFSMRSFFVFFKDSTCMLLFGH